MNIVELIEEFGDTITSNKFDRDRFVDKNKDAKKREEKTRSILERKQEAETEHF